MSDENNPLHVLALQVAGLSQVQQTMLQRLEDMAKSQADMRAELTRNTQMTETLRDASAFVRVGTVVLKWIGVIAIAVGSIVAGFKMAVSGAPVTPEIGPKP